MPIFLHCVSPRYPRGTGGLEVMAMGEMCFEDMGAPEKGV